VGHGGWARAILKIAEFFLAWHEYGLKIGAQITVRHKII
jgi:hypothetical protein